MRRIAKHTAEFATISFKSIGHDAVGAFSKLAHSSTNRKTTNHEAAASRVSPSRGYGDDQWGERTAQGSAQPESPATRRDWNRGLER
jgi:hypothetical protein